jgi:hypothetical protein
MENPKRCRFGYVELRKCLFYIKIFFLKKMTETTSFWWDSTKTLSSPLCFFCNPQPTATSLLGFKVEFERPKRGREPSCWKSLSILILPSLQVFPERNIDDLETSMRIRSNTAMDNHMWSIKIKAAS